MQLLFYIKLGLFAEHCLYSYCVLSAVGPTTNPTTRVEGPFWRVELSGQQRTFVAVVVIIAIAIAVGTIIFACIWCLLDKDGLCPECCVHGSPKDTFSPQRWWMEALAQRVENLEAGQPLMERKGRREKVGVITRFEFCY